MATRAMNTFTPPDYRIEPVRTGVGLMQQIAAARSGAYGLFAGGDLQMPMIPGIAYGAPPIRSGTARNDATLRALGLIDPEPGGEVVEWPIHTVVGRQARLRAKVNRLYMEYLAAGQIEEAAELRRRMQEGRTGRSTSRVNYGQPGPFDEFWDNPDML